MSSIIDNKEKTMLESLKNSLKQAESVDILTAFFYFSGFNLLADELKDKKIRILVGNTIDPDAIEDLCRYYEGTENLETYAIKGLYRKNNSEKKSLYIDSFKKMFNSSTLSEEFDSSDSQSIFKMFFKKIEDGSLEIKFTSGWNHAKAFILTNKQEHSCNGDQKGIVFTGSSNFTYNGLIGQGEMNEDFRDNTKYQEYLEKFDDLWEKAVDISVKNGNNEFVEELKKSLWIFAKPEPYKVFIRILYELYHSVEQSKIETPHSITSGKFSNLKYQIDAIKYGVDCVNKNNGVIIADVVGLGKSIIASAIAYNLNIKKTVIISPPHLIDQWNNYQQDFGLPGVKVCSSGKIEEVYKTYSNDPNPIIYIIDEAHRYRNELSEAYQWLHQLTRSNPDNKIILLTATPYNNRPQDLFALIKLFQTPSRSTINTVDNLGVKFHELIAQYNKLEKKGKRNLTPEIRNELNKLSSALRALINPVIIRRSRLDLDEIQEYKEDLKQQGIQFPEIIGPELVEYDLGNIRDLYVSTLSRITNEFVSARYNPTSYLIDPKGFKDKYKDLFNDIDIQQTQTNLAKLIKRQLVMRFESSKSAFKSTLNSFLSSYENIKKWWDKGYVPIKKSGFLPDPNEDELQEVIEEINSIDKESINIDKIKNKAIPIPKELFNESYISAINSDINLLEEIYKDWFETDEIGEDPKYNEISKKIKMLLEENNKRKIVVFSIYSDTAEYVYKKMSKEKFGSRVFLYTGKSNKTDREIVAKNFDASYPVVQQANDYDIIIATDALSEGFNLNRAGVIINYDIPYNPTRVVQRIGRINRINKKMFDNIYIYNFFPTDIGEKATLIKGISTMKMLLINSIVGSDTKTLTPDEDLRSYFKKQYDEAANNTDAEKSWDNDYRNIYNSVKDNQSLMNQVLEIPDRVRIVRKNQDTACAISFAKKGNNTLFAISYDTDNEAVIASPEEVLKFFKATVDEKSYEYDQILDEKFTILRDTIKKPYPKINNDKRKGKAIENLEKLKLLNRREKDYIIDLIEVIKTYDDLSDGELKYLANILVRPDNAMSLIEEIKMKIPTHYINQIKQRAESIEKQTEIIMFTEDLRNDNN